MPAVCKLEEQTLCILLILIVGSFGCDLCVYYAFVFVGLWPSGDKYAAAAGGGTVGSVVVMVSVECGVRAISSELLLISGG